MTTKKEAKKRKRAQKKKDKRKINPAQTRLLKKVETSKDLPVGKVVIDPEGQAKMSEVILDFAAPLLEQCQNEESEKIAIAISILIWNLSLLPEKTQDQEIEKMCSGLSGSNDTKDNAGLIAYSHTLLERKKQYYSDNKRTIINYQVSGSGKNRRLDVASTLST